MILYSFKRILLPLSTFTVFLILVLYIQSLLSYWEIDPISLPYKILYFAIHILFWFTTAFLTNRLLKIFLWEGFAKRPLKDNVPQLLIDIVSLLVYGIALTIIVGFVFDQPLAGIWATSGVVAIILGLAIRNIILDIFTGLAVNIEKPYQIGDWIKIYQRLPEQNIIGQVLEINWRATRVKTEENSIVVIPNSVMSTSFVTNYWIPNSELRQKIVFCIDFSVPVERVRRILLASAKEALEQPGYVKKRMPEVLVKQTTELGVDYEIRYWINSWRQISPSRSKDIINTNVLRHLAIAGISLAYPKEDIYYGKLPVRHFDAASLTDRKRIVSGIELFAHLPSQEIADLAEQMHYFEFKSGEEIVRNGEEGDSMFILVEGVADVLVSEKGTMVRVSQLYPGQFFGEMSLLTGDPRSADVTAITDLVVYQIHRDHLSKTFRDHPEFIEKISEILVERKYQNAKMLEKLNQHVSVKSAASTNLLVDRIRSFFKVAKPIDSPR